MKVTRSKLSVMLVLLVIGVLLAAVGCGGTTTTSAATTVTTAATTTTGAATTATTAATTTTGTLPKITAKLGSVQPVEGPYTAALNAYAKRVSDATGGNLTIEVYPAQQLGTARELIESTQKGAIQMVEVSTGNFTQFWAPMAIVSLPYLFTTAAEVNSVLLDGAPGQMLLDGLSAKSLRGLAFWPAGLNQMTGNFPISKPEDLKGKKIRVLENPVLQAQFKAFGATPVAINFGELYNALQQGVADGQENAIGGIFDTKLYEVQKYMAITNHGVFCLAVAANKEWYDKLPAAYQKVLTDEAKTGGKQLFSDIQALETSTMLPKMKEFGMVITDLTAEQRDAFAKIGYPAAETALLGMMDAAGAKILDEFKAALKK